jgi:hypothetical protein
MPISSISNSGLPAPTENTNVATASQLGASLDQLNAQSLQNANSGTQAGALASEAESIQETEQFTAASNQMNQDGKNVLTALNNSKIE